MEVPYSSAKFIDELEQIRYEPTRMLTLMADAIEKCSDGNLVFSDPTTPAVSILELTAGLTAAAIRNDYLLNRKHYPLLATTNEDLFDHMTDRDFVDMFASPSRATFNIYLSKSEVIENSVQIGQSKSRKLTIPKHTQITVNGIVFTLQHPINFMVKSHGGLDIIYDLSKKSPLHALTGNKINWRVITVPGFNDSGDRIEYIELELELLQMSAATTYETVSAARVLKKTITFNDMYLATRAYYKNQFNVWVEMRTTHSDQTFDSSDPTLLLKVVDNTLTYELPHVYMLTDLVGRELRLDIYTTKGPINMDLSELDGTMYGMVFKDLDNDDNGLYTAPMSTLRSFDIRSTDITSGGRIAPTFEERRKRVLENNIGANVLPVTEDQMQNVLSTLGFDATVVRDDMLSLTFLATRSLPRNSSGMTLSGIESTTMTYRGSVATLSEIPTTRTKGDRVTLLPETLYSNRDGRLEVVTVEEVDALLALSNEAFVNRINSGSFLWSPFHYVIDGSDNSIASRIYSFTDPKVDVTSYIGSNETVGLSIMASTTRTIKYVNNKYVLTIVSDSSSGWKDLPDDIVFVQLAFIPQKESSHAYLNGTLKGKSENGERIYEFVIDTSWDITSDHVMELLGFRMKSGTDSGLYSNLDQEFALIWSVAGYRQPGIEPSFIDGFLGTHLLPANPIAVYMEEITLKLGDVLDGLWNRSRAVLGDKEPRRYTEDVHLIRKSNIYEVDPQTGRPIIIETNGVRSLKLIHAAGTPVINEDTGLPEVLFTKGSIMFENGEPLYESDRYTQAWFDLVLFDAKYRYVTYSHDTKYLDYIPRTIVDWVTETLEGVRKLVLPNAQLFFQPKDTLRYVPAVVDDGQEANVYAAQNVTVDLFVTEIVYKDYLLREALEASARQIVVDMIQSKTVKVEQIERTIVNESNGDILTVRVAGVGGKADYRIVSLKDDSTSLSIGSTLTIMDNGTLGIVDSIQVNFRNHTVTK